ncbi:CatB-related O-acetyltransferase [soil metagenome]
MNDVTRGEKFLDIKKGKTLHVEPPVNFRGPLEIRNNTTIGAYSYTYGGMLEWCKSIGRYCSIAGDLRVGDIEHPTDWLSTNPFQYNANRFAWSPTADDYTFIPAGDHAFRSKPPVIGNDVWIGARVTILRGVTVGDGAIIASSAVVTKDVPPYAIVGGLPGKVIRYRFPAEIIADLLDIAWWRFTPNQLSGVPFDDIDAALAEIRRRIADGMEPYEPELVALTRPTPAPLPAPVVLLAPVGRLHKLLRRG